MANESQGAASPAGWKAAQVYSLAAVCLILGVTLGYLFRGSQARSTSGPTPSAAAQAPAQPSAMDGGHPMPTLEQMKQMADKKAEPLLTQLKSDPNNAGLLIQVGRIYESTHQFKEAADYFQKSLAIDPRNPPIRTEMASCLYYAGDVDGAISQLQRLLQDEPKDADSLFNLGMMKWKGKNDASGAVTAWQQLLKLNPQLPDPKKAQVQKLISEATQSASKNK